ncbi:molybdopterin-dependent oxidoreductase [Nocardioides marmorisolisilvae]|uniref:Molybdopterin oxidoreductase family protein n=1 Tax=Nocardioides marmorisolisilvae TaxID=1542737 RepID=A0A3N0DW20_9ACTN|nr:molybdopterin-dependent oxidoreductase [Nocardioides marmorisolisilvae]RNL79794.1 molybdopterin oxidoreductase family protein [Nocardioides marmorisolisilvae]
MDVTQELNRAVRLLPIVGAGNPVEPGFTGTRIGVCNLCEAICGLEITLEKGEITGIRGNEADPLSRGHICPKGVALADVYNDPDRLRHPVKRVGEGAEATWEEISWDEALDTVADNLAEAINENDPNVLGIYIGNPNAHALGAMTHGFELIKSFKTRNKFSASSVDQIPHMYVGMLQFGHQLLLPVPDIDRTQYLLVFGANPMASNGSLWTVPDFPNRVRELKARGGKMTVFDPRRTETAKVATEHQFVRPASDAAVLLAMVHTLFEENLTSPAAYLDNIEVLRAAIADFTPEYAASVSGVDAEDIRRITREFAGAESAAAYGRMGLSTQGFGSLCQWAINLLNMLTGNLDREGGALFSEPAIDVLTNGLLGKGHYDAWRSRVRGAPEFGGELPVAVFSEEIETPGEGQIKAVLTIAGNPVLSTPDGRRLSKAFETLDFMASVDIYLNETTRHANVILPPTSHLERDHYDLALLLFNTRNTARFTPGVFPKPEGAMHDWEIFREITLRTNARLRRKKPLAQRLAERARLSMSPAMIVSLLLAVGRKTTMGALRKNPQGVDLGPLRPTLPGRLQTKNKRIDLAPAPLVADLDRLRTALPAPAEGELVLIGRRHKQDCNSWMHNSERLTKGKPRHHLLMNPGDLAARGITDGAVVRVTSRVGEVEVEVTAADDMMPGVVSLPHGYGHQVDGTRLGHASTVPGVSINDLTDPERLDVSGNAALSGVPVTVEALVSAKVPEPV